MGMRTITVAVALALLGCGGGGKGADSPGTCPAGTTLKGSDCVPTGDDDSASSSGGGSPKAGGEDDKSSGGGGGGGGGDSASGGSAPYDKEMVSSEMKQAARQVKANCGTATDDEGKASGPWGSTKVSIVLGRNGHVKQVTIPDPYDGKPVGKCAVQAFQKIQFPPYPGSSDVILEWDVEIVQPKP